MLSLIAIRTGHAFAQFRSSRIYNICAVSLSCYLTDHKSGNTSLDTLLALLQAEGAKIEEETEVSIILLSPWMTLYISVSNWYTRFSSCWCPLLERLHRSNPRLLLESVWAAERLTSQDVTLFIPAIANCPVSVLEPSIQLLSCSFQNVLGNAAFIL